MGYGLCQVLLRQKVLIPSKARDLLTARREIATLLGVRQLRSFPFVVLRVRMSRIRESIQHGPKPIAHSS